MGVFVPLTIYRGPSGRLIPGGFDSQAFASLRPGLRDFGPLGLKKRTLYPPIPANHRRFKELSWSAGLRSAKKRCRARVDRVINSSDGMGGCLACDGRQGIVWHSIKELGQDVQVTGESWTGRPSHRIDSKGIFGSEFFMPLADSPRQTGNREAASAAAAASAPRRRRRHSAASAAMPVVVRMVLPLAAGAVLAPPCIGAGIAPRYLAESPAGRVALAPAIVRDKGRALASLIIDAEGTSAQTAEIQQSKKTPSGSSAPVLAAAPCGWPKWTGADGLYTFPNNSLAREAAACLAHPRAPPVFRTNA